MSYLLNMQFRYPWPVWIIGVGLRRGCDSIAPVASNTPRLPRGCDYGKTTRASDSGHADCVRVGQLDLRPGGLKACSALCNGISLGLIALSIVVAIQLYRGKPVGVLLVPMVIVALASHCTCGARINTIWQSILSGYAPPCQVIHSAATLLLVAALRGARSRWSVALVLLLLAVTVFIVVGHPLWGFPWAGCVG